MSEKQAVLVVDNDLDVLEQVTIILERASYRVVTAGSREEAENVLLGMRPDLAIVDLMMEEMDSGFVLAHHIKQLYPDTPVILLTAVTSATGMSFGTPSTEARSWLKAECVLDKPVRPDQLRAEVQRLLATAAHADAPEGGTKSA